MKINKDLEAQNKWFASLTVAEQRMAIAQDVIDQIEAKQYIAKRGQYFVLPDEDFYDVSPEVPQELLGVKEVECKVCAMGAVFASRIRLGNSVDEVSSYGSYGVPIIEGVAGVFTRDEMELLENAFEGIAHDYNDSEEAEDFYNRFDDSEERLKALMYGIINNNGDITFDETLTKEIKK